jgi:hypothetical protein
MHLRHAQSRPVDALVAAIATEQYGVIARRQLVALGIGRGAIEARVARGQLHPVFRAVYAVGHRRVERRGRWLAAVLASGEGSLLACRSATTLS